MVDYVRPETNHYVWTLGDDETGQAIPDTKKTAVVQMTGTFSGATVSMQISNNGSTFSTVFSATSATTIAFDGPLNNFRAITTGGDSNTAIVISASTIP